MVAPDEWFEWASRMAMLGWVALSVGMVFRGVPTRRVGARLVARWSLWAGGRLVPVLLCIGYALCILQWWGTAEGGFGSLAAVGSLFETPGLLLAGWVHFLAFDLWIGRWQVDRLTVVLGIDHGSRAAWLMRTAALPCLWTTFLLGPVGLLLFMALVQLHLIARGRRAGTF